MRHGLIFPHPPRVAAAPRTLIGAATPGRCDRTAILDEWQQDGIPPYRNGSITGADIQQPEMNDCTWASLAHSAAGAARVFNPGVGLPALSEDVVLAAFAGSAGVGWPATDAQLAAIPGLDPLDVARFAINNGLPLDGQNLLVPRPGVVDTSSANAVAAAIERAGGLWAAVRLYQADEDAIAAGEPLRLTATPGRVVAGHMTLPFDYPTGFRPSDDVRIVTYDGVLVASVEWLMDRLVCGWAIHWTVPVMPMDVSVVDLQAVAGWARG